jgi:hypothetical protein
MNASSPLASFRPNFDHPWRGAPPKSPPKERKPRLSGGKPPWSPSSKNPRKHVTFDETGMPPRPHMNTRRRRPQRGSRSQSPPRIRQSKSKAKSKTKAKSTPKKRSLLHLRYRSKNNKVVTTTTIAPYWISSDKGPSSPNSLIHPNNYQPVEFPLNDLQKILDSNPKRRQRILPFEMIDAAMRGNLTKIRLAIEVDGVDPDYVDPDLWGDTALIRASEYGALHVVKYLVLNARANVEFVSNTNRDTAMKIAEKFKRHHVVAFLCGFLSWQRKTESSTYLTRRAAADVTGGEAARAQLSPKRLLLGNL